MHIRPLRRMLPRGRSLTSTRYGDLSDRFAHLRDRCLHGPAAPRGFLEYKPAAGSASFSVADAAIIIDPVQGGPGPMGCLIYTANPATQNDAYMVYQPIGPAEGTPIAVDYRFEITVTNAAGTALPPVVANEWRVGVGGLWEVIATFFNLVHVGSGNSGNAGAGSTAPATNPNPGLGYETKDESVDGISGEAIYPTLADAPVHPWRRQFRVQRRASNEQLVDVFERAPGPAIWVNDGWTRLYTIDRSTVPGPDNDFPPRPNSVPFGDSVWLFVAAYASVVGHDVRTYLHTFWPGETLA